MKVLGIDPGTRSFDLVLIERYRVVDEKSVDTEFVAREPRKLLEVIESFGDVDLVVAPSGYGVPPTFGDEVLDIDRFSIEVLLLSTWNDIEEGIARGEVGAYVYRVLALVNRELVKKMNVLFIPSVILLPTVPRSRKLNKVDMGTADKLSVAMLALYTYSKKVGKSFDELNLVVVELGFGYNAVVAIQRGRIVDGIGGTSGGMGFLTAGALDLEIVAGAKTWRRTDVFRGGVYELCRTLDLDEALDAYQRREEPCASAVEAMIEGVVKSVAQMATVLERIDAVLLSGRYSRNERLRRIIEGRLAKLGIERVEPVPLLEGARMSKEAAQGYAIVGEGLAGGFFESLVKHAELHRACGTVADYIVHPAAQSFRERVIRAYMESIREPKLCVESLG